jgi:hypothetical protein
MSYSYAKLCTLTNDHTKSHSESGYAVSEDGSFTRLENHPVKRARRPKAEFGEFDEQRALMPDTDITLGSRWNPIVVSESEDERANHRTETDIQTDSEEEAESEGFVQEFIPDGGRYARLMEARGYHWDEDVDEFVNERGTPYDGDSADEEWNHQEPIRVDQAPVIPMQAVQ